MSNTCSYTCLTLRHSPLSHYCCSPVDISPSTASADVVLSENDSKKKEKKKQKRNNKKKKNYYEQIELKVGQLERALFFCRRLIKYLMTLLITNNKILLAGIDQILFTVVSMHF